jgi:hypothetical protein
METSETENMSTETTEEMTEATEIEGTYEEETTETEITTVESTEEIETGGAFYQAVLDVQALIDALPAIENINEENAEDVSYLIVDIYEAMDSLTPEQMEELDLTALEMVVALLVEIRNQGGIALLAVGDTFSVDGIQYTINSDDSTVTVKELDTVNTNTNTVIQIPETVAYNNSDYTVAAIGDSAFMNRSDLTSITLPSSVSSIGQLAFCGCINLASINIPSGVTNIENETFMNCNSLTSIEIPSTVTSIGARAFSTCSALSSVEIIKPSKRISIGEMAFNGCSSLKSIDNILASVTTMEQGVFENCTGLTDIVIPSNITSLTKFLFVGCTSLTSITIPSSVTSIEKDIFGWKSMNMYSNLKSIKISASSNLTINNDDIFSGCNNLTDLEIICNGQDKISSSIADIIKKAEIKNLTISGDIESINKEAFENCSTLETVVFPSSVKTINSSAFSGCTNLNNVKIPDGVTVIWDYVFNACTNLKKIEIPYGVTNINEYAFAGCEKLESIKVPNTVGNIEDEAFFNCTQLKQIEIPYAFIDSLVFANCSSLKSIGVPCDSPIFDPNAEIKEGSIVDPDDRNKFKIKDASGNITTSGDFYKTHRWKCKDNGDDTITAYCSNNDAGEWSVTINVPNESSDDATLTYSAQIGIPDSINNLSIIYKDEQGNVLSSAPNYDGTFTASISAKSEVTTANAYVKYVRRGGVITRIKKKTISIPVSEDYVEKKPQIVNKIYGDKPFTLYASGVSSMDNKSKVVYKSMNETILKIDGSTATILKSGTVTVIPCYINGDYSTTLPKITVKIAPAELLVKADDKLGIISGDAMPELTYQTSGLVGNDTFSSPILATTATDTNTIGTYDINIAGGIISNPSYNITYQSGTMVIIPNETQTTTTQDIAGISGKTTTTDNQSSKIKTKTASDKQGTNTTTTDNKITDNKITGNLGTDKLETKNSTADQTQLFEESEDTISGAVLMEEQSQSSIPVWSIIFAVIAVLAIAGTVFVVGFKNKN